MHFEPLHRQLESDGIEVNLPEVQGVLCGLICGGVDDARDRWLRELDPYLDGTDPSAGETRETLHDLYEFTRSELEDPGLVFCPLLPDDGRPLRDRARALVAWCEGFLFGLGMSREAGREMAATTREALQDIAQITRMDLLKLQNSAEDEAAYIEIVEFVRVAVMLVYDDRAQSQRGRL